MARVVCITLNPALDLAFNLDALTLGHVNRPNTYVHILHYKGDTESLQPFP